MNMENKAHKGSAQLVEGLRSGAYNSTLCCFMGHGVGAPDLPPRAWLGQTNCPSCARLWIIKKKKNGEWGMHLKLVRTIDTK